MARLVRHLRPALKHGGFSATAILPGEDPIEFKKLHDGLITELAPSGVLEETIVANLARLMWRKQHLSTVWNFGMPNARESAALRGHSTSVCERPQIPFEWFFAVFAAAPWAVGGFVTVSPLTVRFRRTIFAMAQ